MVIRGEIKPEAQAAAVASEKQRHFKFFVFEAWAFAGSADAGTGRFLGGRSTSGDEESWD